MSGGEEDGRYRERENLETAVPFSSLSLTLRVPVGSRSLEANRRGRNICGGGCSLIATLFGGMSKKKLLSVFKLFFSFIGVNWYKFNTVRVYQA
jgi:hypothetical protein